jgi:hypothetical protein
MIKIQNNIASRDSLPDFLVGLAPESLLDLSWTDPALGVSDCAWWPEMNQSPPLNRFEVYGSETLTIDQKNKVVVSIRQVVPMPQEQVDALIEEESLRVRAQRDAKLAESDWTQGKDIPDSVSTKWATYRQALRDVPQQADFPNAVVWPQQPE